MSEINIRYRCQNLGGFHLTTPAVVYMPELIQFCIYITTLQNTSELSGIFRNSEMALSK